jgi:hypothetical protein
MKILESEELYTFYATADDMVKITCPQCGIIKNFEAKQFMAPYRGVKAKCTCGKIFRCAVEFRRYYRKQVNLQGEYKNPRTGVTGPITIVKISLGGIDFICSTADKFIMKDDVLDVSFHLDDAKHTLIIRKVRVQSEDKKNIGAAFIEPQLYDKELGFYLLPS